MTQKHSVTQRLRCKWLIWGVIPGVGVWSWENPEKEVRPMKGVLLIWLWPLAAQVLSYGTSSGISDLSPQKDSRLGYLSTNSNSSLVNVTPTPEIISSPTFLSYFCARNVQSHETEKQRHLAGIWSGMVAACIGITHHSCSCSYRWARGMGNQESPTHPVVQVKKLRALLIFSLESHRLLYCSSSLFLPLLFSPSLLPNLDWAHLLNLFSNLFLLVYISYHISGVGNLFFQGSFGYL